MINIAVCDDDLVFASKIESILYNIAKQKLIDVMVEVFSDGSELWKHISSGEIFELLYLDIEMMKLNGIDLAKKVRENDTNVIIIYISSYENYFIELFEVEPFRFIKKPVDEKIFIDYFDKAYERIIQNEAYFEYKFNKVPHKILTKNIMYFESCGRLILVRTKTESGKFYGKLNAVEKQLQNSKIPFLRIHQSYLVNYRFVQEISFSKVVLTNNTELQISEDRQKEIRTKYNELLGGEFLDGGYIVLFNFINFVFSNYKRVNGHILYKKGCVLFFFYYCMECILFDRNCRNNIYYGAYCYSIF